MPQNFTKNFGSGLLAGGLLGVVLGLLFAPKSGVETRENLKAANEKYRGKANEELKASIDRLSEYLKPLLQQSNELIGTFAEAAEQIRQNVIESNKARSQKQITVEHPAGEESTEREAS